MLTLPPEKQCNCVVCMPIRSVVSHKSKLTAVAKCVHEILRLDIEVLEILESARST